jgi:Zn-dependent M28 family amino/carboxypeptidase
MKNLLLAIPTLCIIACGLQKEATTTPANDDTNVVVTSIATTYANTITAAEMKTDLYIYASDEFEGRDTGEPGQKKAIEFLKNEYKKMGIPSAFGTDNYFQPIPASYFEGKVKNASENVLAFIKGSEKPEEIVVLSAHLDHVGHHDGEIYNGADDDGSGTVALLEMAEAFHKAKEDGKGPKRSILILHVTAEEKGLFGSRFYSENPVFPLENTVADINVDMIGRVDPEHKDAPNYVYVIGADRLSTGLDAAVTNANKYLTDFKLDYKYNDRNDPERIYYRSDHYNFAKNGVPSVFFFSGIHEDYHKPTDTPDKIDYPLMTQRTKLIFYTAWELANSDERIKIDRDGE